ncbi:hypothetical protein BVRB_9g212130 [Beta vulgaris subsp. vulgaris]|nr:hypothetical protein BVRB_9g212130 [Beta vulgaris subsp. vulgaris]
MARLAIRRQVCEGCEMDDLSPNIVKRVQKLCQYSRTCKAYFSLDKVGLKCKTTSACELKKHDLCL